MIHVDEEEPSDELESQFNHRKVTFKRNKDVRSGFDMLCEIGRGKFGRVMKCCKKDSGEVFAAKFVTCARREDRRNVEREVDIMNCLRSPRILQLYEAYDNGRNEMCLVTEYIGGGELFDRVIEDEFVLTERACRVFVKQILEGVNYIHRQGIIHLDLKPENILCMSKSGNRVKIIDFGLARKFEPMKKLQILFGTPEFVAPEVVNFEPIGYSTDMWALGVITYVLVSGLSPFMGDTDLETMANVTIAEYDYEDEAFDNVSDEARSFIDSLLVKDQAARASSEACLSHPWIKLIQTSESDAAEEKEEISSSVKLAKDNHSLQKTVWNNRDSNYYLFDYKSRTASQLYEMNLTLNPKQMGIEDSEVTSKEEEVDQFSFFTPDGIVRSDTELTVDAEGKITARDSDAKPANPANEAGVRKRSLEDVKSKPDIECANASEENIEYVGLVKRPKTPLITSKDIAQQVAAISERKQSGCGSLPDVISSSVDTQELYASRCSLLEDNDLLPLDRSGDTVNGGPVTMVSKEASTGEAEVHNAVVSLPDIVIPDDQENGVDDASDINSSLTPTITIEEQDDFLDTNDLNNVGTLASNVTSSQVSEISEDVCDTVNAAQENSEQALQKTYTVEEGFERPWDNMVSTESVCGTDQPGDDPSDSEEDDDTVDDKSSSSSSFPSESSGIFYKAEYTPPPPTASTPVNNLLSIENRDEYWRNFFARNSNIVSAKQDSNNLQKSQSGCDINPETIVSIPTQPSSVCKSKSDAKICYSTVFSQSQLLGDACSADNDMMDNCDSVCVGDDQDNSNEFTTVTNTFYHGDIDQSEQEQGLNEDHSSNIDVIKGQADVSIIPLVPRNAKSPLREEIFDKPWTEVGGDSPEQSNSKESLTTTISQEMQDLLASIQSLGKNEESSTNGRYKTPPPRQSINKQKSPSPLKVSQSSSREKNVDFENLMKEVEHQIRFSVTAELLERMANCPSIENYFLSEVASGDQSRLHSTSSRDQPTSATSSNKRQSDEQLAEAGVSDYNDSFKGTPPIPDLLQATVRQHPSSLPAYKYSPPSQSSPDYANRRYTNLPRPSDIPGVTQVSRYPQPTGNVPDMWSRVKCPSVTDISSSTPRSSRSENTESYSDVCADLFRVKNDIDSLCDIINYSGADKYVKDPSLSGQHHDRKIERDLRDTRDVMKDIEHTVDSFRRHLSLPSGKIDYNENNTANIKSKRVPYPANNQGNVSKAKDKFEIKSREVNIQSKSRGTTPFGSRRSPSPSLDTKRRAFSIGGNNSVETCEVHSPFSRSRRGSAAAPQGTKLNLRKRSPSPVVTGKVSSFRSKFESVPNTPPTPPSTWSRHTTRTREPHEIFSHSLPNQNSLHSPGNIRTGQKLSRDSSASTFNNSSLPRNTSSSRLPNHFINLDSARDSSSDLMRPKINRAQSLRGAPPAPRGYFSPSDSSSQTQHAACYLKQILPKMSPEDSKLRGPFGYRS